MLNAKEARQKALKNPSWMSTLKHILATIEIKARDGEFHYITPYESLDSRVIKQLEKSGYKLSTVRSIIHSFFADKEIFYIKINW